MRSALNRQLVALFHQGGFTLEYENKSGPGKGHRDDHEAIEADLFRRYRENHDEMLFHFAFYQGEVHLDDSLAFLGLIGKQFLWDLARTLDLEELREKAVVRVSEDTFDLVFAKLPFAVGRDAIDAAWVESLYVRLTQVYARQIQTFEGTVETFLAQHNVKVNVVGRVFFHLVESAFESHPFAFLATYSQIRRDQVGTETAKSGHIPLKNALLEFKDQQEQLIRLLSTVSKAAEKSPLIAELVRSGELFSPLKFTAQEAYTFLKEIPLYESCGILCRMPDWWKQQRRRFKLSLNVGDAPPAQVGMEALLSFDVALHLGDDILTDQEIRAILDQTSGLTLIKGKWVEVDHEKLEATLAAYEKAKTFASKGHYTLAEAMRLQLTVGRQFCGDDGAIAIEVTHGQWLKALRAQLTDPGDLEPVRPSPSLKAELRAYQRKGLQWLYRMNQLGFGACLADDMGLGKTVQVIALLDHLRQNASSGHPLRTLLVLPASLMGNWQRELEKFAPELTFKMLYNRQDLLNFQSPHPETAIYLTTYGMVARSEGLRAVQWDLLIIDEAQAIKNPGTKQTKAVKAISARSRIALTGTPIENSLTDLWSLFDFLNAGLLGTASEFNALTKRLRTGVQSYGKLREVVAPFILRRLKTDRTIIDTLPEKMEMKAYTTLTKKQVVLYSNLVKDIEKQLASAEGIGRKGLVLASLMKFKQICNHPDQYLGQGAYHHEHSGKFERLTEICETIYEKRERVLVFTQFREMVEPLSAFLETRFKRKGLVLHGGTPVKQRAGLVESFNGEEYVPYMVLSLKAGGVGLNLTAANHVIHFDRWWNPAVENQATDRAYRIGQERNVMVHKFITMGTIEEKIDTMIESKSKLSGELISSTGEAWITELSNVELLNLFRLD